MTLSVLNITILGVGALGTLFGAYLSSQANVTLFGSWQAQIDLLQKQPLTLTQPDNQVRQQWLNVTNQLHAAPPADIALILVKSYQTERAAHQAAEILRPDGLVVTLQNGVGNLDKLADVIGAARVSQGVTTEGANLSAPGQLHHAAHGTTVLGLIPNRETQIQHLADLFNRAGLKTTVSENIKGLIWGKLAINAGINPLTALLEVPNGILASDDMLRPIMIAAATEVARVAQAQGIELPFTDVAARAVQVSLSTGPNRSSMLQDLSRGAPTEIMAISGSVINVGQRLGIPTPVNALLFQLIKKKEGGSLDMTAEQLKQFLARSTRELLK